MLEGVLPQVTGQLQSRGGEGKTLCLFVANVLSHFSSPSPEIKITIHLKVDVIEIHKLLQNGWSYIRVFSDCGSECWGSGFSDNFKVMYNILQKCTTQWFWNTETHLRPQPEIGSELVD